MTCHLNNQETLPRCDMGVGCGNRFVHTEHRVVPILLLLTPEMPIREMSFPMRSFIPELYEI